MYCRWCGASIDDPEAKFCPDCGKPVAAGAGPSPQGASAPSQMLSASQAPSHAQPVQPAGEGTRPRDDSASHQKGAGSEPAHHRKAPVAIAAGLVVVAALALGAVVWGVTSGGGDGAPSSGQDANQVQPASGSNGDNTNANADGDASADANAEANANATNDSQQPSSTAQTGGNATTPNDTANGGSSDNDNAAPGASSGRSELDPAIARLNGWWTTVGGMPYNPYTYFKDGIGYVYSHDGEPEGTWTPQAGDRVSAAEFGDDGTIIRSSVDSDFFYVLRDSEDILDCRWYDNGKLQYSGTDSLVRCDSNDAHAAPNFAPSAETSLGGGQSAAHQTADTSFQQQKPTITGWTKQPLPLGDGVIYRCAWTPIDGAEGYELRGWILWEEWEERPLVATPDAYYDFGSSEDRAFGAQVRAYKTVGHTLAYTQWSDRSNFDIPEYSQH